MSAEELADYSAAVVLQVQGESVYVLDAVRTRLDYSDLRRKEVIELHRRWRCVAPSYSLLIEKKAPAWLRDTAHQGITDIGK